jgi:hypothetical protein
MSQIIPPDNLHIVNIKKAIGRFVWAGMLYKIDRRQLNLKIGINQRGVKYD